jgi:hypothetical protein
MPVRLSAAAVALFGALAPAQEPKPDAVKPAGSRITAVTVYQTNAMVTREVSVPEAAGLTEVVVSPLPPSTMQNSLYAEGGEGLRVLSARYRTRAIAEDTREEVRKLETKIKTLQKSLQQTQSDLKALEQNAAFVTKLEGFTAATLAHLTDRGQLDSEKTIALATFVTDTRNKAAKAEVTLKQALEGTQEEIAFTTRLLQERAGGVTRTERDAVIVLDKTKPGAGTVRLNYLVQNACWHPQYKLRAGTKDKDPVQLEYLAALTQQTGEDWSGVALTLSTAQPLLNAAPPDLLTLEVGIGPGRVGAVNASAGGPGGGGGFGGGQPGMPPAPPAATAAPQALGAMPAPSAYAKDLAEQSKSLRRQSQDQLNKKEEAAGGKFANDAAALDQYRDLLLTREELAKDPLADGLGDGPSVTFRLKDKLTLPSRTDDQILEIAKLEVAPKFYYKAVPVLTPHVYRIADLTNTTDYVLLPGEATMYLGSDFVGQTKLPLVAVGRPFTVGFGADPQLQVTRKLVDKTRTTQGGNQVATFKYRILLSGYKPGTVDVQVWDRLPHAEAQQTIAVTLTKPAPELSSDPLYVRDERPRNLLRWDVKLDPKQNGERALPIEYEYKIELDRTVTIGSFLAR